MSAQGGGLDLVDFRHQPYRSLANLQRNFAIRPYGSILPSVGVSRERGAFTVYDAVSRGKRRRKLFK